MNEIAARMMTAAEFDSIRDRLIQEYAAENVAAGHWPSGTASSQAREEMDRLLPQGVHSPGVLMLVAETPSGQAVGFVWLALEKQAGVGGGGWIYNIEVRPEFRGQGFGRALLTLAETAALNHGVDSIGLNVSGRNVVAHNLYEAAGYSVATMQLTKKLT